MGDGRVHDGELLQALVGVERVRDGGEALQALVGEGRVHDGDDALQALVGVGPNYSNLLQRLSTTKGRLSLFPCTTLCVQALYGPGRGENRVWPQPLLAFGLARDAGTSWP